MRTFVRTLAATATATLALGAIACSPTDGGFTVSTEYDTITVTGSLRDELAPISIGSDPTGDAIGSGAGVDLSEYAVSFPEPGKVAFHVTLGDANPATGYSPQGLAIEITPTIGDVEMELTVTSTLDGGLEFSSQTCAPDPVTDVNTCTSSAAVGSYADGVLTWIIPTNAAADTVINGTKADSNYYIGTGVQGVGTVAGGIIDTMSINAYATIPSATLLIDGVASGNVILSDAGYTISAAGLRPGSRAVSVKLCGGEYDFSTAAASNCTIVGMGRVSVDIS
jgi:hypothetical protein